MLQKMILACLAALLVILQGACAAPQAPAEESASAQTEPAPIPPGFVPALYVLGDVDEPLRIDREYASGFTWRDIEDGGASLKAVPLDEVVLAASPRAALYDLLLVGSDGLSCKIGGDDMTGCNIAFSEQFAWECVNYNHPISSRVKMLQKIIVMTDENTTDPHAAGIVSAAGSRAVTAGRLQTLPLTSTRRFEGRSEINGRDVSVYTPHLSLPVLELVQPEKSLLVAGYDGGMRYFRDFAEAELEVQSNRISYNMEQKPVVEDIAGLMADPPLLCITEAYNDALHLLERGENAMIIELDGWGWQIYEQAAASSDQKTLGALDASRALAVFPPISPVGLASLLTGKTPDGHGVHDRENKRLQGEDLFARASALGKTAAYIEGDTSILETSLAPALSPDLGGEPGTDDEVYAHALKAVDSGAQLVFVHFHGIDDNAAAYGPYAPETMAAVRRLDGYAADLIARWNGKVIITADHGLHPSGDGGSHGAFSSEDMIVPYIITQGGANGEPERTG